MIKLNTSFLLTVSGILKISESVSCVTNQLCCYYPLLLQVCVLILLLIIRFGGRNYSPLVLGSTSDSFLCQGTVVGFTIIIPAILVTHLLGGNVSILELVINLVGGVLFLVVGGLAISYNARAASELLYYLKYNMDRRRHIN